MKHTSPGYLDQLLDENIKPFAHDPTLGKDCYSEQQMIEFGELVLKDMSVTELLAALKLIVRRADELYTSKKLRAYDARQVKRLAETAEQALKESGGDDETDS